MTRAPLTPASVGVAEHADHDTRFGLIHKPLSDRVSLTAINRHPYKISCGPPLKAAKAVQRTEAPTDEWCPDCWNIGPACTGGIRPGPVAPFSEKARRATPFCHLHGDLTRAHVDYGTARDVRDEHLRAGGAG